MNYLEKFVFNPKEGILYLPLASFLERDLSNSEILWHIYYELALYPDWKKNADLYLKRRLSFKDEIDQVSYYLQKKLEDILDDLPTFDKKFIRSYVEKEILDFLFEIDCYSAYLKVLETCPFYRDQEEKEKVITYMKKEKNPKRLFSSLDHQAFSQSFLLWTLFFNDEGLKRDIEKKFGQEIMGKSIYEFLYDNLLRQINDDQGIIERDPLIKAFIYPNFKKLWLKEIDSMNSSQESSSGEKIFEDGNKDQRENKLESSRADVEERLREILKEEKPQVLSQRETEIKKLEDFDISREDIDLFSFYENKISGQRRALKEFWKKLLGSAKKEVQVEKDKQAKGDLNVNDLIYSYPDFLEAEKKGAYKDLKIFNRYFLESKNNFLPEKIEISFLIDNSGSMDEEKIEAMRKTLAAILLSLEDFNDYLQVASQKTNEKIELLTETWFFGRDFYKVKNFTDTGNLKLSKIISSVTKVDGSSGTTDDGACLREIYKNISPREKVEIKAKKTYKIIFEITDGASTFPGATRDIVKEFLKDKVEIYALQIGPINSLDTKTFNYIWNDGFKYPHGIILGENIESLTEDLIKIVRENLESIFLGR